MPVVFGADTVFLLHSFLPSLCAHFFLSLCRIYLAGKKNPKILASTEPSFVFAGEAICVMQGPPPATHHQCPGGDTLSRIPQPAVHRERSVARGHNSAVITVLTVLTRTHTHTHPDT